MADIGHEWTNMHSAFNNGAMDNFVAANGRPGVNKTDPVSYYLPQDHSFYSWLFSQFAISDSHYAPMLGPTWPNRDYLVWESAYGMIGNNVAPPKVGSKPGSTDMGIFSQLKAKGITWKMYWSPGNLAINSPYEGALGWNTMVGQANCNLTKTYCATPRTAFESDLANGTLPQVAFYEASSDEHPGTGTDIHDGEIDVRRMLSNLMKSSYWPGTVVILTYDEGGGYFDHKRPPVGCDTTISPNDFRQRGMRVPLVAISPFARKGYVSHVTSDHASILRFIQARFDLPAMTLRDANANALLDLFDLLVFLA